MQAFQSGAGFLPSTILKFYVPGCRTAKNQRAEAEGCFGHMHSLACQIINL